MKIEKYHTMRKYIYYTLIVLMSISFASCTEDEIDKNNSIFSNEDIPPMNEFDYWLYDNYVSPYNIKLEYRFNFADSEFDYNLTPPIFEKAVDFSQIIKYCWLEAYDEVAGTEFTRSTSPKQITLIGSQALTAGASSTTSTLGTAVGGTRVLLYEINYLEDYSFEAIIEYMHVMHHEFSHILDQRIPLDPSFRQISEQWYLGDSWMDYKDLLPDQNIHKYGFVTPYSMRNEDEDYAEIYSRYLTMTDAEWDAVIASGNKDEAGGGDKILRKLDLVKAYISESWGFDLDEMKECVRRRAERASVLEYKKFNEFVN